MADPSTLGYMKLKKFLMENGCTREEVNACGGKPSLLHLWQTKQQPPPPPPQPAAPPPEAPEQLLVIPDTVEGINEYLWSTYVVPNLNNLDRRLYRTLQAHKFKSKPILQLLQSAVPNASLPGAAPPEALSTPEALQPAGGEVDLLLDMQQHCDKLRAQGQKALNHLEVLEGQGAAEGVLKSKMAEYLELNTQYTALQAQTSVLANQLHPDSTAAAHGHSQGGESWQLEGPDAEEAAAAAAEEAAATEAAAKAAEAAAEEAAANEAAANEAAAAAEEAAARENEAAVARLAQEREKMLQHFLLSHAVPEPDRELEQFIAKLKSLKLHEKGALGRPSADFWQFSIVPPLLLGVSDPGSALYALEGQSRVLEYLLDNFFVPEWQREAKLAISSQEEWHRLAHQGLLTATQMNGLRLLSKADSPLNTPDWKGETALHNAAHNGHVDLVLTLLNCGADIKIKSKSKRTALWVAASRLEAPHCALALIEAGADVHAQDSKGWTVLAAAADSGCLGLVPVLVSGGADLAVADNYGWTPLHKAAEKDQLAALVDIIREGADLNAVSKRECQTPLMKAAMSGKGDAARLLLQAGADVSITDKENHTALMRARKWSRDSRDLIVEVLVTAENCAAEGSSHDELCIALQSL